MSGGKQGEKPSWFVFFLAAGLILFITFSDELAKYDLILPAVGLLIIGFFGFSGYQIFKSWRQPDEAIFQGIPEVYWPFFMLFGLFGVCFAVFWCYLMITKAIWWLSFPGIIIGAAFARPLVAGLRLLRKKYRKHKKEADPWDRPDIER